MKRLIRAQVELPAKVYRKDEWYIADCEILRLRSQGRSEQEALDQLRSELEVFIEHCHKRETLDRVLRDCGFERAVVPADETSADIIIDGTADERMLTVNVPPAFIVSVPDARHRAS